MSKPKKIKCGHCNGTGTRAISVVYDETLRLLRQEGESTGAFLSSLADCKPTAMNNRLVALESLGLAKSRRFGRERLFTAI